MGHIARPGVKRLIGALIILELLTKQSNTIFSYKYADINFYPGVFYALFDFDGIQLAKGENTSLSFPFWRTDIH